MFESLFATTTSSSLTLIQVIMTMAMAFLCGGVISFTYRKTSEKGAYSQNFGLTMIMLPAVVAIIILLIGSDVARAFSLAGAFSIIRFRSAPGEPKDIAYVLFAMAAGLAAGANAYAYAVVFTLILCLVMFILYQTRFRTKETDCKILSITIPEDVDYEHALEDIFEQYTSRHELKRIKTASLGSLFQLYYEVELLPSKSTKAFIDDLRCRNGNLNIQLRMCSEKLED